MARQEADREDILVEATALVQRAELRVPSERLTVFVGFRRLGALSLFWTPDEVYHFHRSGAWRRGFWRGELLKAEQGRLWASVRERTDTETTLRTRELANLEQRTHVTRLQQRLATLKESLTIHGQAMIVRSVEDRPIDWPATLIAWIDEHSPITVAERANV